MQRIYLDHNATTTIDPLVVEAMNGIYQSTWGNFVSQHTHGQQARQRWETAREQIIQAVGGKEEDRVIVTSGGTESNNLALRGLTQQVPARLVISSVEHPSVAKVAEALALEGWQVITLKSDAKGIVDLDQLNVCLLEGCDLVSIIYGNHETGTLQPMAEISQLCAQRGVPLHSDASQVIGKMPIHFADLNLSAITLASHKFHGPPGIGGLVVRHGQPLRPLLFGGPQQLGERPGTQSIALAVGMATALQLCQSEGESRTNQMRQLRDHFEDLLCAGLTNIKIHGRQALRLPQTSNIAFPPLDRQSLLMRLDLAGVSCSTGSACNSGSSDPSPVLIAMGIADDLINSSLRFSLAHTTTITEIELAARRIIKVVSKA